jgi:hypothetical protein
MGIYIITILILSFFSILEVTRKISPSTKKIMIFFAFILLVFQTGLRWETGTDWWPYFDQFKYESDWQSFKSGNISMEKGYQLFNILVKYISNNYSVFLFIHAIIFYTLIFKSFKSFTPFFFTSILLLYTSTMGMMGSNRQLLALGICLIGLNKLIEGHKTQFFVFVIIASFFHLTALLFLIYFFFNKKIEIKWIIVGMFICLLIGFTELPLQLFSLFGRFNELSAFKTEVYLNSALNELSKSQLSLAGLIKRILFLILFLYTRDKILRNYKHYNFFLNGYILGIAFYFLFSRSLLVMISRGSFYFNIMEPILLSYQLTLLKKPNKKFVLSACMCILAVILFFQSIAAYPDLFIPYKGIWINTSFHREMY